MKNIKTIWEVPIAARLGSCLILFAGMGCSLSAAIAQEADSPKHCYYANIQTLPIRFNGFQPLIEGSINGKPITMTVDTGADSTLLFKHAAERLGLTLNYSSMLSWGGGGESGHYRTRVKEIKIGPAQGRNQYLFVIRNYSGGIKEDGLAGSDFLFQRDMEMSLSDRYVKFYNAYGCENAILSYWDENAAMVTLKTVSSRDPMPEIDVIVNGKKLRAMIDSGAPHSIIDLEAAAGIGITLNSPNVKKTAFTISGIGEHETSVWVAPLDTVAIGDETIKNAKIIISDIWGGVRKDVHRTYIGYVIANELPQMILGADFLRSHRVLFSVMQKRMYFSYLGGNVFSTGDKDDLTWYRAMADRGDANALYELGSLYFYSKNIPHDAKQAIDLFSKAAEKGNERAQAELGFFYENGYEVPKDLKKAADWYRKAAEGGNTYGKLRLGRMYEYGMGGMDKDKAQAISWYQKAAEQDDPYGQLKLAALYSQGKGVPADKSIAHAWLEKATKGTGEWWLGRKLFELGMHQESESTLRKVVTTQKPGEDLEYSSLWLYLAQARAGKTEGLGKELEAGKATWKEKWPLTIADFYLGRITADQFMSLAHSPDEKTDREQVCEANFYTAEWHLINHRKKEAQPLLQTAARDCPKGFIERDGAIAELDGLEDR